jgi:hypothetical protein
MGNFMRRRCTYIFRKSVRWGRRGARAEPDGYFTHVVKQGMLQTEGEHQWVTLASPSPSHPR